MRGYIALATLLFAPSPARSELRKSELAKLAPPLCKDEDNDCAYWAHTGECSHNWAWMKKTCARSCGACLGPCADAEASCTGWAKAGECESNERFMLERCPASCDLCPKLHGKTRECDGCLVMQEVAWRLLQPPPSPPPSPDATPAIGVHVDRLLPILSEMCITHEWTSLDVSLTYQHLCERLLSRHYERMIESWRALLFGPSHPGEPEFVHAPLTRLLDRSLVLKQKHSLCAAAAPAGLGACGVRQLETLRTGHAVGAGACESCRAYVMDAVAVLRRTGFTFAPSDGADYRRAAELLRRLCDDLEMRHNTSAVASASLLYEQCTAMASESHGVLVGLLERWPRLDIVDHMCTSRLQLCSDAEPWPGRNPAMGGTMGGGALREELREEL